MTTPTRENTIGAAAPQRPDRIGISVVLPCYNECDNIQEAYEAVVDGLRSVFLCTTGSTAITGRRSLRFTKRVIPSSYVHLTLQR